MTSTDWEISVAEVSEVEAKVLVRYHSNTDEPIVLRGTLRGPYCERAHTLSAEYPFRALSETVGKSERHKRVARPELPAMDVVERVLEMPRPSPSLRDVPPGIPGRPQSAGTRATAEAVVTDPCLWSEELPHLYRASVEALRGDVVVAEYHGEIGLRRTSPARNWDHIK